MNTIQLTVCQPGIYVKNASQLCNLPSKQCLAQIKINVPAIKSLSLQERPSFGLQCLPVIRPRQPLPVCLAGGKEMMDNDEMELLNNESHIFAIIYAGQGVELCQSKCNAER
ncbi:hypothetical protein L6164_023478 [Bauhinia variegata]|uniref:Uncharacterized protein n=1 Tax=Bauhinia variegata TaxID=167791 RepID=A0ACB9MKB7_BAUVA|nr:hypothetical protein L6164_023478 [Bauhinia variegata]